jgi:dihydrofolate reductase
MRKLIFTINMTIDGCCDHTKGKGSEEVHDYFAQQLRDADTLVYGRKVWQLMVPYWPDVATDHTGQTRAAIEFAQAFVSVKEIVVFSRTLGAAEDKKTRIVRSDLQEEIQKLKQAQGRDILLGGVDLSSQLIALGLVDEYRIVVQPIVAGAGRRLMEGIPLPEIFELKLVDTFTFKSGCIALRYVKQG